MQVVGGTQTKEWTRRAATGAIVVGVLLVAYAAALLRWGDPATALYARWQQNQLGAALRPSRADAPGLVRLPGRRSAGPNAEARVVEKTAREARESLSPGDPIGRLIIPKLGLRAIVVEGTGWKELAQGPGRYPGTSLPGLGSVTAVAGHRTTFGAPFRKIDALERGDEIVLELPYGRFAYRVFSREIVEEDDWSILEERRFETLVLSACHPLYGSSQRWVVYARLAGTDARGGRSA